MNKITHLIPATEFLLQLNEELRSESITVWGFTVCATAYAKFLSQPLQERMFVGEDRFFEGFYLIDKDFYVKKYGQIGVRNPDGGFRFGLLGNTIEALIEFKPSLTPKALEQICESI